MSGSERLLKLTKINVEEGEVLNLDMQKVLGLFENCFMFGKLWTVGE